MTMQTITPRVGERVRHKETGYEGTISPEPLYIADMVLVRYPAIEQLPQIDLSVGACDLLYLDRPIREQVEAAR